MRLKLFNVFSATAVMMVIAAGCRAKPDELRHQAIQAAAAARAAFEHREPEAAERAASRAQEAATQLEEQVRAGRLPSAEAPRLAQEARAAADSARNYAQLADEERQSRDRLASLKFRAYRSARASLSSYAFGGLAPAADHFAQAGTNPPSSAEQQVAQLAWSIAKTVGDLPPTTNGAPDWGSVAATLRAWSKDPPPSMGMFLAAAFALNGLTDFALSELESVDASQVASTNGKAMYHLERSVLFAAHGWDRTAARELNLALQLAPEGWCGVGSTQAVALIHVWRAGAALQRKELLRADEEIAAALKVWPQNPMLEFLTAEKLAGAGDWAKAADGLEARAADTRDEWLAKRLAQRAQELRNAKGDIPSLFADPTFLLELGSHALNESLSDSVVSKWLQQFLTDAKAFGRRAIGQSPRDDTGA
jgi:hypothetical protein